MFEESNGNLEVTKVVDGSLAAEAGIQTGDISVPLDGEALHEFFDLLYLLSRKSPGTWEGFSFKGEIGLWK